MQMHMERAESGVGHICRCARRFGTATTGDNCDGREQREDTQNASTLRYCRHTTEASAATVGATAAARERRRFVMVLRATDKTIIQLENDNTCSLNPGYFRRPPPEGHRQVSGWRTRTYDIASIPEALGCRALSYTLFAFVNAPFWYPRATEGSSSETQHIF